MYFRFIIFEYFANFQILFAGGGQEIMTVCDKGGGKKKPKKNRDIADGRSLTDFHE